MHTLLISKQRISVAMSNGYVRASTDMLQTFSSTLKFACIPALFCKHPLKSACFSLLPLLFPFLFLSHLYFCLFFFFFFSLAPSLTLALEAFECDLVQSKCTAIGSLPPLLTLQRASHDRPF